MEQIYFSTPDWENVKKVFRFYRQETTCLDEREKLVVCPSHVIAMGDDMISALYAVQIINKTYRTFGIKPHLLCVGGIGILSKYLHRSENGKVMSEGLQLMNVAQQLGNSTGIVLDKGNNIGANIKDIIDHLVLRSYRNEPVVFCLNERLSKRVERTVAFSPKLFPGTPTLNAFYYVPEENLREVCKLYNGKAIANGLPLLSEAAVLYDRMNRYQGIYLEKMDKRIDKEVVRAGEELVRRYPIRVTRSPLSAPRQFCQIYFGMRNHQKDIAEDLSRRITEWKLLV